MSFFAILKNSEKIFFIRKRFNILYDNSYKNNRTVKKIFFVENNLAGF